MAHERADWRRIGAGARMTTHTRTLTHSRARGMPSPDASRRYFELLASRAGM